MLSYLIVTAIGLFLIFEGVLPFVAPNFWRRMVRRMSEQSDRTLHITGFICMILGLILIFASHHYILTH